MIPEAAVAAAARAIHAMWRAPDGVSWEADADGQDAYRDEATAALEAAAPHMLAGVTGLADKWEAEGEQSMAAAKKIPDEHIAMTLLVDGATMIENARLIRNAIGSTP